MNPEAALLSTIVEIQDLSHRMFFNSLNCHANKLLDKVSLEPDKVIFFAKKILIVFLFLP